MVTYHPVTLEYMTAREQFSALLRALDETDAHIIFTKPNSDSNGRIIASMIDEYVNCHSDKSVAFTSLGISSIFVCIAIC